MNTINNIYYYQPCWTVQDNIEFCYNDSDIEFFGIYTKDITGISNWICDVYTEDEAIRLTNILNKSQNNMRESY